MTMSLCLSLEDHVRIEAVLKGGGEGERGGKEEKEEGERMEGWANMPFYQAPSPLSISSEKSVTN